MAVIFVYNKNMQESGIKKYLTAKNTVFLILALAFLLRVWGIGSKDMIGDEATYAFRSIGYLDYLGTNFQTQPVDWYKDGQLPDWTHLSFHDHPPLVFIIQNLFFRIFGDSLLVARLPGIILGTVSVFIFYLLVKMFFGETIALLSAFLFTVSSSLVAFSRTALMEPILLFFVLLNIYFFFRFLKDKKWWWVFGITFGLVLLTKYIGVFLAFVYLLYLVIADRKIFKQWRFYASFLITLVLFSPVIIYNIFLYKTRGHFDLQFAYLFGQNAPEWTGLLGKIQSPFKDIGKNLLEFYGIPAMVAIGAGFFYSIFLFAKRQDKRFLFWWIYVFSLTVLLMKIGSAHRFLSLYGPAFYFFAGFLAFELWSSKAISKFYYLARPLIVVFVVFEFAYSINNNFTNFPDYGIAKLDNYLIREFKYKESAVIPGADNQNLNDVIRKFAQKQSGIKESKFLLVYNDNIVMPTLQWIFYRRFFYHSIPTFYVENFISLIRDKGAGYLKDFEIYFIQSTENTLLNPFKKDTTISLMFEDDLIKQGLEPVKIIYGQNSKEMFRIYKFSF
ncbi:MAG: putative 4-amino-4-deoxy-l-arabinose lipid A transferase [Parcubacteria group bacterium Athens1014_26]|nr:MAG: putative 4-amino-4-deoxy-l-arabinose lipid A transferase [Parcubacteria group bacterium Athens1014_26]